MIDPALFSSEYSRPVASVAQLVE
ncbi:uncharacterized protein METZ01_LOCUS203160, partial [marine metagenome]